MCMEKTDWEKAVEFHGHSCPGLAIGYRVAKVALRELAESRAADEELVAIVENDACGVDAVQVLTGCTLGKGNLLFRDYGKHVFTFVCRNSGKAVRISIRGNGWRRDSEDSRELREKVFSGTATPEEEELFRRRQEERIHHILEVPEEEFCTVQHINAELPPKARIFSSVTCAFCGEPVAEARARVREGKFACIPCAGEYSRGW
ncbi:MAG: FmdE family protein [Bacillota bacterium]